MTHRIGTLVLGVACVAAFGAAAGAVDAPVVDVGTEYDVAVEPGGLLSLPAVDAGDGESVDRFEVAGLEVETGGRAGWLGLGWLVGVLGLWLVVALRATDGYAALGVLGLGAVVLAVALFVGVGGGDRAAAPAPTQRVSFLGQLVTLLLALVTVLSGVVLLIPDDADAYSAGSSVLGFLPEVVADVAERVRRRTRDGDETAPPDPDNEVYETWLEVAREHGTPVDTPGEVAQRAVGAGLPPEAVEDLRRAFEAVRYGGAAPTDDRVERARSARRRLTGTDEEGASADEEGAE